MNEAIKDTRHDAFFFACASNDYHSIKDAISKNKLLVMERNQQLETGLHVAIREQAAMKVIQLLLDSGSNVNTKDLSG